jgi:hypothetical protein
MRNKLVICFLLSFIAIKSYCQREDYNWLSGENYNQNLGDGKNIFTFNDIELINIDSIETDANFYITNSSISDSLGNLVFYTNGRKIYNAQHLVIENGDSLNFNNWWQNQELINRNSYGLQQGTLILKDVIIDSVYHLFHLQLERYDDINLNDSFTVDALLYTKVLLVDGESKVLIKNKQIINSPMFAGNLTACRHGNGRDWWILASEGKSNCIYQMLLTHDTLVFFDTICSGMIAPNYGDVGEGVFSPNGELYIKGSALNGIDIFDFDRCSGVLSHKLSIPKASFMNPNRPVLDFIGKVVVSPNSKFLYTGPQDSLLRFDLNATDIINSKELVSFINWNDTFPVGFVPTLLGSDGIIYNSLATVPYYNTLNNPDEEDSNLLNFDFLKPTPKNGSRTLGNFPNFRLGPLTGSACDTLGVGIQEIKENFGFLVKPNPASTYVEIDYGNFPWQSSSQASLHIYNLLGELVYTQNLPQYSGKRILDIQNFAAGVYVLQIKDNGNLVGTEKLVVYR